MEKKIVSMFMNARKSKNGGFTLIEILVVIGIIALLATIVIVAINPARQFAQARNTQRTSNVNSILNAIGQNIADNKGVFTCGSVTLPAGTATSSIDDATGGTGKDLSCLTPTYMPSFPVDPSPTDQTAVDALFSVRALPSTNYYVSVNATGRVSVCAPSAKESAITTSSMICVTR